MNEPVSSFAAAQLMPVCRAEWEVVDERRWIHERPRLYGKSSGYPAWLFGLDITAIIVDEWHDVKNSIVRHAVQTILQKPNKAARWFDRFRRWPGLATPRPQCGAPVARVPRPAFSQVVARREKRRQFVQGLRG